MQCFDGDGCCGDDCRVGVVVLLVVVMLMVVVWKLVFMLVVAVVIMVVVAGGCCAMSTWKKPLAAASVSLSVSRSSSSCGKQPLSLSLPPTSEELTFISFVQHTIALW